MPKLLWREPIETTVITSVREDDAANKPGGDATAGGGTSTAREAAVSNCGCGDPSAPTKGSGQDPGRHRRP